MIYLAEIGGADPERSYKDAGGLTIIGPFESSTDAEEFYCALDDDLLTDYAGVKAWVELSGQIEDVCSPADRLREELERTSAATETPWAEDVVIAAYWVRENVPECLGRQLDKWCAGWVEQLYDAFPDPLPSRIAWEESPAGESHKHCKEAVEKHNKEAVEITAELYRTHYQRDIQTEVCRRIRENSEDSLT